MQTFINFLRGSVPFTVTGAFPERFLNLCAQQRVAFWDLEWVDAHTLRLRAARRDAHKVRRIAEKVQCEAAARRGEGLPFFLAGFRKRYALLIGLVMSIGAVCVFSQFILTIEVSGNQQVSTSVILSELARHGVRVGAYGPGLDVRRISQESLIQLTGLSWMSVNLHGTRAEVLVREKLPEPETREENTPAHVVAEAPGIITHMEVLEGQPCFQEGDTVLEGEILISGVMDLKEPMWSETDAGQRLVHARGSVYARTWRSLEGKIPLTAQVKAYTGESGRTYSLTVLGHRVNILGKTGIPLQGYDKISKVYTLTLPGGREMPLALEVTEWRTYETATAALDPGAAQDLLETQLSQRLTQQLGEGGEVVSSAFTARAADGMLYVTLQAECLEQIGREVTFPGTAGEILPGADA